MRADILNTKPMHQPVLIQLNQPYIKSGTISHRVRDPRRPAEIFFPGVTVSAYDDAAFSEHLLTNGYGSIEQPWIGRNEKFTDDAELYISTGTVSQDT